MSEDASVVSLPIPNLQLEKTVSAKSAISE